MAEQTLRSPTNPHFFKPLLPGFDTHLNVPVAFFVNHVQGSNDHIRTAKMRTDASDNTWLVKVDGLKLTDASSHDINNDSHDQTTNNTGGTGAISSFSFEYCFLAEVTASNLKEDKLFLPVEATSCTALNKQFQETILVNKEGNSWKVSLRFSESGGNYYITRGWRKFSVDNRCKIGDVIVFNVVGDGKTTPLLCVCPERKEASEILSKHKHLTKKSVNVNRGFYVVAT
ncbi:hypothetical protein Bca52824_011157 [Brassica carinata]|uniref:TF-B3 domain-containing protein n=1 Tax=Brassica carinata TaxID=52824 RepID=A0A8X7WET6_BRACI|nr:hypothetical protein Bca52824_011157 [Brassica carinata]